MNTDKTQIAAAAPEVTDIKKVPEAELRTDLDAAYGDMLYCETAIKLGIKIDETRRRLEVDRQLVKMIEAELSRRRFHRKPPRPKEKVELLPPPLLDEELKK